MYENAELALISECFINNVCHFSTKLTVLKDYYQCVLNFKTLNIVNRFSKIIGRCGVVLISRTLSDDCINF